jgi:hypothetical protein
MPQSKSEEVCILAVRIRGAVEGICIQTGEVSITPGTREPINSWWPER